jgi:hypothetical protein
MKNQIIILAALLLTGIGISSCFGLPNLIQKTATPTEEPLCPPLPDNFSDSDLVGTWVAEYFGGLATDKLMIREDGLFKQVYSSQPRNFESDWKKWRIEYDPAGYALLHLEGMRRCDDIESICNNAGGGLPSGEVAINQCSQEYLHYENEVILLVTGYTKTVLRGIVLRQARLAGSDWTYSFHLDESTVP